MAGRLEKRLAALSIYTAGQLVRAKLSLLRHSFGVVVKRMAMELATAGFRQKWAMRRDRMSPCYTTRLADVLHVIL